MSEKGIDFFEFLLIFQKGEPMLKKRQKKALDMISFGNDATK